MTSEDARKIAVTIASTHAYDKHVLKLKEFPEIPSIEEFRELIFETLIRPSDERHLERNRHAYWNGKHNMVVVVNPNSSSGGTAFRPERGKDYFLFTLI